VTIMDNKDWELLLKPESGWLPGFDEAFVGMAAGNEKTFALTYPKDSASRYRGQAATFQATIKEVRGKLRPELDDEFAKTLAEMTAQRAAEAEARLNDAGVAALIEKATLSYPPVAVDEVIHEIIKNLESQLERTSYKLEDYLRLQGTTLEAYRGQVAPQAERRLQSRLVLTALTKVEGITVTDEETQAELKCVTADSKSDDEKKRLRDGLSSEQGQALIRQDLMTKKTLARLRAIVTGQAPELVQPEAGQPEAEAAVDVETPSAEAAEVSEVAEAVEDADVVEVAHDHVRLATGEDIAAGFVLGVAGARPHRWLEASGLTLKHGFITVDGHLRSISHPEVFAVGDCADLGPDPRPKAGVYAVRAAPILLHNLRAMAMGRTDRLCRFRPQRDYLKLISLGDKRALAEKRGLVGAGAVLWHWKNRIDQRFMRQFRDLVPMAPDPLPREVAEGVQGALGDKPLCGGCGAKLGPGTLAQALAVLPRGTRADVESCPGDDAAVLRMGDTRQVMTTDHLRAFTADHGMQARIAAVHALGDCWAMGARPQAALASLILPRLSPALQRRWTQEIMAEAAAVFAAEGAEIVGGHSSMGDELTIGFTVTGLLDHDPITLAGARPGDRLILTKPLGTGTILAAEMQLSAQGAVVAGAWTHMAESSGPAATLLAPHATAMTDVTGFGLAGHLMNICDASGVGARLSLGALPVLPGAQDLLAAAVLSSVHAPNRAALEGRADRAKGDDILYDPQTAGGLLATVPAAEAGALLDRLRAAGIDAVQIGEITAGPARIKLR